MNNRAHYICTLLPPNKVRTPGLLLTLLIIGIFFIAACNATPVTHESLPSENTSTQPHIPYPAHRSYVPGTLKPNHISQQQQDDLVRTAYDNWKQDYLVPVKSEGGITQMYRVSAGKTKKSKTVSEGQGYGMVLAAYMAGYDPKAREIFDGLLLFAKNHPSRIDKRFMVYQVPVRKSRQNSAFDGDCDMALALILADSQWGSSGYINYRQEALELINALMETVIGSESRLPMLGDWVEPDGQRYNQYSLRSSDIMPTHFKLFYTVTGDQEWLEVVKRCQALVEHMQTKYSQQTGLLPDFIVGSSGMESDFRPAPSRYLESGHDGHYFYNAARVPWRLGFDALLNSDPVTFSQVTIMARWAVTASSGQPSNIGSGYMLNGEILNQDQNRSKAFIAPFGVAAMSTLNSQDFVNSVFDLCVTLRQDYYEDTIGLLCLLLMTGNCWLPG